MFIQLKVDDVWVIIINLKEMLWVICVGTEDMHGVCRVCTQVSVTDDLCR